MSPTDGKFSVIAPVVFGRRELHFTNVRDGESERESLKDLVRGIVLGFTIEKDDGVRNREQCLAETSIGNR